MERFESDRGREGVAAESRAMRPRRKNIHDLLPRRENGNRQHAAAQGFAQHDTVRPDVFVLKCEPGARPAQTGLNFVKQQQDAALVAQAAQAGEPAMRRNDNAGFPLYGLDEHGGGVGRDCRLHRREVSERGGAKARRKGSKPVAIFRLRGETDDRSGAAVKIPLGDDDYGLLQAFDAMTPAARRLDRRLYRLRSAVHRQRDVETSHFANFLEEWTEPIIVIGSRRHRKASRLLGEPCNDARMGVTKTHRRIGAHHVDVAPSFHVPQMRAFASRENDRQRLVVPRAVSAPTARDAHHPTTPALCEPPSRSI